jgi:sec-independent protein translocase protein TatA
MVISESLAMWAPSFAELMVIMVIALLLFGKRLPEVARSLGKGVVEFKKGLKGIEDDVDHDSYQAPKKQIQADEKSPAETKSPPAAS